MSNCRYVPYMSEQTDLLFREVGISNSPRHGDKVNGSTARVWKNWECAYTLKGHERAVWAVLSLGDDEYLTGPVPLVESIES